MRQTPTATLIPERRASSTKGTAMEPHGLSAAGEGDDAPLTRVLGLWQLSLAGIGIILGAGIYALLAPAAALAGYAVWA